MTPPFTTLLMSSVCMALSDERDYISGADLGGVQRVQLHPPSFFYSLLFTLFIVTPTILIYKQV